MARLHKSGGARLLADLRTPQATQAALGGPYPAVCLDVGTRWTSSHPQQLQKLANALVGARRFSRSRSHSAEPIAEQWPAALFGGDRALYAEALQASLGQFSPGGLMPPAGPATVLRVLQAVDRAVQGETIDLARTHTSRFVRAVPP